MKRPARPRSAALLGAILLAPVLFSLTACGTTDDPPTSFARPNYDYLTKLRLAVSSVDVDDSWAPRPGTREVGNLAPTPPVEALRQMARDRLFAGGPPGRAVFVIDDASIVQNRDQYEGKMVVHLDVTSADGTRSGYAEARVARTRAIAKDTPNATRAALGDMVNQMMLDMNVEFEFQVRRSLRAYLLSDAPAAALPKPIQSETLAPPGAPGVPLEPYAPAPAAPLPLLSPAPMPLSQPLRLSPAPQNLAPQNLPYSAAPPPPMSGTGIGAPTPLTP